MKYICRFCDREFSKETTLAVHLCSQKRRYQEQNEPGVRVGFQSYLKFYEATQGSPKTKTYEAFSKSPYYGAFVKFGRYCVDSRVINPVRFTDWLLKHNKKIDYWASDKVYEEFLLFYLTVEKMEDALTRAIEYSIKWGEEKSAAPQDFLRYGNYNTVLHAIVSGRISAWVLYNSDSGQDFLSKLTDDQRSMIWKYINPDIWSKKIKDEVEDRTVAQELLKKAGW